MPNRDVLVLCGGCPGEPRRDERVLALHLDGAAGPSKVNLELQNLARAMLRPIPAPLADLVEIACYVFSADQFTTRDTPEMHRLGAAWRRNFRFRIPVRDTATWQRSDVLEQLTSTLAFLSEDAYAFEFERGDRPEGLEPYLGFNEEEAAPGFAPDKVFLFSGGLDSLAGSAMALLERNERVALVSHRSSAVITPRQRQLVRALRQRAGWSRVFHVGVTVNKGGEAATEYTQRCRSFLFAALGLVVARMFGKSELSFAENGVISMNLPLARHVVGTRSTRTTHPRVLADFEKLFSLVTNTRIAVGNPLFWLTKTDIVRRVTDTGCAELIPTSFSCSRVGLRSRRDRHCGTCSQCIDRRFAVLAAGLEQYEPSDLYAVDLFTGARKLDQEATLASSYVLSAKAFSDMTEAAFTSQYGEIYRALPYLIGSKPEIVTRLHQLHARHGKAVIQVVNDRLARGANVTAILSRAHTSLLAVLQTSVNAATIKDAVEEEPTASEQAATIKFVPIDRPIGFAIDEPRQRVYFKGGVQLKGALFELFNVLRRVFDEDQAANLSREQCRTLTAGSLADRLARDESTVRKYVAMLRRSLQKQFRDRLKAVVDEDDIIENVRPKGYRLNPYLVRQHAWQLGASVGDNEPMPQHHGRTAAIRSPQA